MTYMGPFIAMAEKVGMPVKLLRYVQANYELGTIDRDYGATDVKNNILRLAVHKVANLRKAAIGDAGPSGEFEAVHELYHESTHAYCDLQLEKYRRLAPDGGRWGVPKATGELALAKEVFDALQAGRAHYNLYNGGLDEADELAHEALAMYIAHRARLFWDTIGTLVSVKQQIDSFQIAEQGTKAAGFLTDLERRYNTGMRQRIFGYTTAPLTGKQRELKNKTMPAELTRLGDRILELKIPDNMLASPPHAKLYRQAMARARALEQAP